MKHNKRFAACYTLILCRLFGFLQQNEAKSIVMKKMTVKKAENTAICA